MSRLPLDLTPIATNTTNPKTSPIDLITIGTKTPEPTPRTLPTEKSTRPMESSKQNGKVHVPEDTELDPSFSDSS